MTMTDERFDATAYAAQVKALRAKFYPTKAPAITPRDQPRIVEVTRPTYESIRPVGVVMKRGKYGPFPLAPAFRPHVAFDDAVAALHERRNPKAIIAAVARKYSTSIETIIGPRRDALAVKARHEAMAEVYVQCVHLSLPQMAKLFQRDHTSCLHAIKKLGVWRGATS
jgi:hypothetical protein